MVKVREDRSVRNRACYLAIGVSVEGEREVLGIWWQETEGAKFWLAVLNDLHHRGVEDILVCCVDGLTGFPEAIEAVYPQAWVQTCIVHQIRSSMRFVSYGERKRVAHDLKPIYRAVNVEAAEDALKAFDVKWGEKYPMIAQSWQERWQHITPFLAFPPTYESRLHHQQHREPQPANQKGDQDQRTLPRRAIRHQAHLPRDPTSRGKVATSIQLDSSTTRPQDPLRRPTTRLTTLPATHRSPDTLHRCAPSPERDRSTAGGTPISRHTSRSAATSACHEPPSRSIASSQQVSSASSG